MVDVDIVETLRTPIGALGCSGARILVTLLHAMKRRALQRSSANYGLAAMCVGVGQSEAVWVEAI